MIFGIKETDLINVLKAFRDTLIRLQLGIHPEIVNFVERVLTSPPEQIPNVVREEKEKVERTKTFVEVLNAGINPVAAAYSFVLFFLEEGAQAVMFAIIGLQQAKRFDLIRRFVPKGREVSRRARELMDQIGWLNPIMTDAYRGFFDAFDAFLEAAEQIAITGKPVWGEQTLWDLRKAEGEE